MDACAEAHRLVARSADVEPIGLGEGAGIAVGSPEHGHDLFAGLDLDAVDIDGSDVIRPSSWTGLSHRNSSSTALRNKIRSSRSRCISAGWSSNAISPFPMRFVVVSYPAPKIRITVAINSLWESWSPCSSTWMSSERSPRSDAIDARR